MASEGYHEPYESLTAEVISRHRMLTSLKEEIEAIDWYDQRVVASSDPSAAAILAHNRDEEKEHAAMALEWLRRNDGIWDKHLRTYLFTEAPITEVEAMAEGGSGGGAGAPSADGGSLGIGSLKGVQQ